MDKDNQINVLAENFPEKLGEFVGLHKDDWNDFAETFCGIFVKLLNDHCEQVIQSAVKNITNPYKTS